MRMDFLQFMQVLFFALISICSVKAQSYFTLSSCSYSYSAKGYLPENNIFQGEAGNILLPLKMKSEHVILAGITYQKLSIRFEDDKQKQPFFSTGINLGFVKKTKSGSVLFMVVPRVNSDKISLSEKNVQTGGVCLITRKKSERVIFKYGLYYNSELLGPFFVPLLGIDWKVKDNFRIFGVLPQNFVLEKKQNNRFRWGLSFQSPLTTYHMHEPNDHFYLEQKLIRVGPFSDFYLTKSIAFQLKIDYPFTANYKIFDTGTQYDFDILGIGFGGSRSDNRKPLEKLTHGLIFQIGINYRVELEN